MELYKSSWLFMALMLISGCSGMQWYEGAMIQYKSIENPTKGEYIIHVMGSMPHSPEDLESAVLVKAEELCGGAAEIIETQFGTYDSTTTGGGLVMSSSHPEIVGRAKCESV